MASRALTGLSAWALGEGSDAVHSDGRHDMHLHARIRGDEQLA
ncbi:hypothetical protein [Micromonospora haikouensis]